MGFHSNEGTRIQDRGNPSQPGGSSTEGPADIFKHSATTVQQQIRNSSWILLKNAKTNGHEQLQSCCAPARGFVNSRYDSIRGFVLFSQMIHFLQPGDSRSSTSLFFFFWQAIHVGSVDPEHDATNGAIDLKITGRMQGWESVC